MFSVIFVLGLLYHTYTDMKSMLLYDKVTLILAAVGLVRAWYEGQLFDAAYGAGIMLAIMLVLYFASRGGMGEGDVKLAPALGIWLGLEQGLLCLLLAFISGGVVGVLLLLCRQFPSDRFCAQERLLRIFVAKKSLHGIGGCSYDEAWKKY